MPYAGANCYIALASALASSNGDNGAFGVYNYGQVSP